MKTTAADILTDKESGIVSIPENASLRAALQRMTQHRVGAIVVENDEDYVGIWTERDLMYQVLEDGFNIDSARIGDYMNTELVSASADEQVYQLYDKFLGRRIRHLLIVRDENYIGLLSVGDVVKASLRQKMEEYRRLNEIISLEYYENWKATQAERH